MTSQLPDMQAVLERLEKPRRQNRKPNLAVLGGLLIARGQCNRYRESGLHSASRARGDCPAIAQNWLRMRRKEAGGEYNIPPAHIPPLKPRQRHNPFCDVNCDLRGL